MSDSTFEAEVDPLYAGPPGDFVSSRDELSKQLKAAGDGEGAAHVKRLRRPSQAASLVNWLSREHREDLERLAKTLESMRAPATGADGKRLRAAVRTERETVAALLAAAEEEAERRGAASPVTVDRVGETLRAMATDPDLERSVLAGRLEKEGEASTLGFELSPGGSGTTKGSRGTGKTRAKEPKEGPDPRAERAALKQLERRARTAGEAADDAAVEVKRAEEALTSARKVLREAKAEARAAQGEAKKQGRRVSKL